MINIFKNTKHIRSYSLICRNSNDFCILFILFFTLVSSPLCGFKYRGYRISAQSASIRGDVLIIFSPLPPYRPSLLYLFFSLSSSTQSAFLPQSPFPCNDLQCDSLPFTIASCHRRHRIYLDHPQNSLLGSVLELGNYSFFFPLNKAQRLQIVLTVVLQLANKQ